MHPDAGPARAEAGAYLLAGGRSRRMGHDKHRLEWDGASMVAHLAAMAAPLVAHVWLVGKRDRGLESHGLPVIYDLDPEPALVHGIRAALHAPGPVWRWLLACDMPDVDAEVLARLWCAARDAGAPGAAPVLEPGGPVEPLPSLWRRDARRLPEEAPITAARDWVEHAGLARWAVAPGMRHRLVNLNTPEEWNAWQSRRDDPPA